MARGLNGHGALHLLGRLDEAVEYIKAGMAEQRNEVKAELAAVRTEFANLRATVEAMSRPTLASRFLSLCRELTPTQWRWISAGLLFLTGSLLRLDAKSIAEIAKALH